MQDLEAKTKTEAENLCDSCQYKFKACLEAKIKIVKSYVGEYENLVISTCSDYEPEFKVPRIREVND